MEITIAGQTWMFLSSIVLGALLGMCYDIFRIIRIAVYNPPSVVVAEDVLFAGICTASTFLFFIMMDCGQIRMFVLIGEVVGFTLYYCTVGAFIIGVSRRIIAGVKWVFQTIWRLLIAPVWRLVERIGRFSGRIMKNLANWLKNKAKNSRMHLKKHSSLLYNLRKPPKWKRQRKKVEG